VDPALVRVVKKAITFTLQDFVVIEGLRTLDRQKELLAAGFSTTLRSKHLTGRAVDIIPYPIPGDWAQYRSEQWTKISIAMKQAAASEGVEIEWGGDWVSFVDKPHFQLRD